MITYVEYDNSNIFYRNSENEEDLYQKFTFQGISYVVILIENSENSQFLIKIINRQDQYNPDGTFVFLTGSILNNLTSF